MRTKIILAIVGLLLGADACYVECFDGKIYHVRFLFIHALEIRKEFGPPTDMRISCFSLDHDHTRRARTVRASAWRGSVRTSSAVTTACAVAAVAVTAVKSRLFLAGRQIRLEIFFLETG